MRWSWHQLRSVIDYKLTLFYLCYALWQSPVWMSTGSRWPSPCCKRVRSWSPQYKHSTSWRKRTCSSKSVEGIYLTWICLTVPKKYHVLFEFSGLDKPSNDRESLPGDGNHCRLFHVQFWVAIDELHVGPRWCSTWSVTTVCPGLLCPWVKAEMWLWKDTIWGHVEGKNVATMCGW